MKLQIKNMKQELALEILNWKYEKPYDYYNNDPATEDLKELLDGTYFALVNDEWDLMGFFCIGKNAQMPDGHQYGVYVEPYLDIGFGMNPELTGKGHGYEFCSFILKSIEEKYKKTRFRLTVAKFNARAIHLYEKLGFEKMEEFRAYSREYLTMVKYTKSASILKRDKTIF
jgi:ribosomal protein S18 acetylase RimI-like enzyme